VQKSDSGIYVIGFSYGGVAAVIAALDDDQISKKILKIYTICSPLNGVTGITRNLAEIGGIINSYIGDLADQISPGSEKLQLIRKAHVEKLVCYYHEKDWISRPQDAEITGATLKKIDHDYGKILNLFAHQLSTIDPRIFMDIILDIEKEETSLSHYIALKLAFNKFKLMIKKRKKN